MDRLNLKLGQMRHMVQYVAVFILFFSGSVPCNTSALMIKSVSETTNYELGYQMGEHNMAAINETLEHTKDELQFYKEWASGSGAATYDAIRDNHHALFPHLMEELSGIADGSGVDWDTLFLLNMMTDLEMVLPYIGNDTKKQRSEHCSDVWSFSNAYDAVIGGHNEDDDPFYKNRAVLTRYFNTSHSSYTNESDHNEWVAYTYPGQLPGNSFAANKHGVVTTVNQLFPNVTDTTHGAGVAFVTRLLVEASSIDEALTLIMRFPTMSGFSLNIASILDGTVLNVEVGAGGIMAVTTCSEHNPNRYAHFNLYTQLNVKQDSDPSSTERMNTYHSFESIDTVPLVREFLGDTSNKEYPVYRTPSDTDPVETLASFIVNLTAREVQVYDANPKEESAPLLILGLRALPPHVEPCPEENEIEYYLYLLITVTTGLLVLGCVMIIWRSVHNRSQKLTFSANSQQWQNVAVHSSDLASVSEYQPRGSTTTATSNSVYGHIESSNARFPGYHDDL